jgi:hypothetical protein
MYKMSVLMILVLVLAMGLIFAFGVLSCFAEESITITTYYPSPYGVYNELQTNKFAVGDTNVSGGLDSGDQPPANGQLYTARSVIFKPQSSLPAFDAREDELVYSDTDNKFYHYDGSSWVAQGGGTAVMTLSCAWGTDHTAGSGHGWDGSCAPPSCPSGWTSAATYSEPLSVACPGGDCLWVYTTANPTTHPVTVGRSVRVCVK